MSDDRIEVPNDSNLNIEGKSNQPLCPVCQSYLEKPLDGYEMPRLNPDTRWFWCPSCEGHLGYHRMRKSWKVDAIDLYESAAFREYFNVDESE